MSWLCVWENGTPTTMITPLLSFRAIHSYLEASTLSMSKRGYEADHLTKPDFSHPNWSFVLAKKTPIAHSYHPNMNVATTCKVSLALRTSYTFHRPVSPSPWKACCIRTRHTVASTPARVFPFPSQRLSWRGNKPKLTLVLLE